MTEPRKPIFGFLWPKPDPDAPVDAAFRQVRKVRIPGRGVLRVVVMFVATVLTVSLIGSALMSGLAVPSLPAVIIGAAISATALVLVLRGWIVGTFVTDAVVSIDNTWRRTTLPWSEVRAIEVAAARVPLLGLPIPVRGQRCIVCAHDGRRIPTHIYTASPDVLFSAEAFDIARLRLVHWFERT